MPYTFNPFTGKFDFYIPQSYAITFLQRIGTFYSTPTVFGNSVNSAAISANVLYSVPFVAPMSHTYSNIAVRVAAAGASGTLIRLGIYNDGGDLPTTLVLDAGTVAGDSTGLKSIVINRALVGGIYWLCLVSNRTPSINFVNAAGMIIGTPDLNSLYSYYTKPFAFGALPSNFPSPPNPVGGNTLPLLGMLRSA